MLKSLTLNRVGPADTLHLDFDPRLNVLTGDNGLGKTFILDIAWWALTGSWAGTPVISDRSTARRTAVTVHGTHGYHTFLLPRAKAHGSQGKARCAG